MLGGRGGKRAGAGRPKGSTAQRRKSRGLTAFDEEWRLIKDFERKLKKFGTDKAAEILKLFDA